MNSTLSAILDSLKSNTLVSSVEGLEGYCEAWKKASASKKFKDAQIQQLFNSYWFPALKLSSSAGLKLPGPIGQIYDASIQIGPNAAADLIQKIGIRSNTMTEQEELDWIKEFLQKRQDYLNNLGPVYAATVTRIRSYDFIVGNNSPVWTDHIRVLNNDGDELVLKCDPAFQVPSESQSGIKPLGRTKLSSDFKTSLDFKLVVLAAVISII